MKKKDERKILSMLASNQLKEAVDAGCSARSLVDAGCSARSLIDAGFSARSLVDAGCSARSLIDGDIPIVEKPYSRMLAAIKARKVIHDQSTFGPGSYGDNFDPLTNVCKTPMCTAGHLVSMAGAKGYELLKKCNGDFSFAAGLIHSVSRPDAPCQNFGSIPQEWAMAYIEERAAEEEAM